MKNKVSKKRRLQKVADRLWFELLIEKDCEVCGKCGNLQEHHFFPKGSFSNLRYDLDNGISICQGCHMAHHLKGNPTIHQIIIEKRGIAWYESLLKKSREPVESSSRTIGYYQEVIKKLEKLKRLDK